MTFRFDPKLIQIGIDAASRDDALKLVARPLVDLGFVTESYPGLVCEREREYPTGLPTRGAPVALAHADAEGGVTGDHIAVGILREPVAFRSMEDMDEQLSVRIVFVLAMASAHAHLEMLTSMMQLIKNERLLVSLLDMDSAEEVCSALNGFVSAL